MQSIEAICCADAPEAIGAYAQAVRAGDWVYLSGQIGLDPRSGKLVSGGIEAEVVRVFDNLEAVLGAAGSGIARLVQVTVYLVDLADFPLMNRIYTERLGDQRPARVTVGVAALPKGARVEIGAVALRG